MTFSLHKYAFDFSASYSGGGLKRLVAFSSISNERGGGVFFVHRNALQYINNFDNNTYFVISNSRGSRAFPFSIKKHLIISRMKNLKFFYSYGIPFIGFYSCVTFLHISNVLPLTFKRMRMPLTRWLELQYLGCLLRFSMFFSREILVESYSSKKYLPFFAKTKSSVSYNGANEELSHYYKGASNSDKAAVCIGVQPYKNIEKCIKVFRLLRESGVVDQLNIIGGHGPALKGEYPNVVFHGEVDPEEVLSILDSSSVYLSCTSIENSFNAALEGILLAKLSYISDIPVHRELIDLLDVKPKFKYFGKWRMLEVRKSAISTDKLPLWDQVTSMFFEGKL